MDKTADSFETSPQQEALWLSEPEGPAARVQGVLALDGAVHAEALRAALGDAVERHESLRTTFQHQPGIRVPVQAVHSELDFAWEERDLTGLDDETAAAELAELRQTALHDGLDLAGGPVLSAILATLAPDRHRLILTISGLCADPGSLSLLAGEVLGHHLGGSSAPEDPLQYADFAAWQRELATSEEDERRAAGEFWQSAGGLASPLLPFLEPSGGGRIATAEVVLDGAVAVRLADRGTGLGGDASAVVQAAWHVLLGRLSGEALVSVAYRSGTRRHGDLDGAIGAFARPVPVTARTAAGTTFAEVLGEVVRGREQALVRQDYAPTHGLPRLSAGFAAYEALAREQDGLSARLQDVTVREAPELLTLVCGHGPGNEGLRVTIAYDDAAYDPASAARLAEELGTLLGSIAGGAAGAIDELVLLGPREQAQVVQAFNATAAPVGEAFLHELFAAHAARAPEAPAVHDGQRGLTYGELEARANQLAHRLQRAGVRPGAAVGLCTDRSTDVVVALLGILKAGAAYVPVHHEHPPARLAHQLRAAGASVLVTQAPLLDRVAEFDGESICLDRDRDELDREPEARTEAAVSPDTLAYVIYTSGSTGTPKGVGVTHGNLRNYAAFIAGRLGADRARLAFGLITAISTDLGNTSVFGALASGGSLVLIDPAVAADAGALARRLAATPVDVLKITPSHIGALLAGGERGVLPRRTLVLGGERAPWDLVARVRGLDAELALINHYGPTEATIGCSTMTIGEGPGRWRPATVPIGRPIANTAIYLLDDHAAPVPIGVSGRLHVAGAGVAAGYVGEPELTAERFLTDPFYGARMYDTGDLARWLPDGTLEFLGRVDEQVKIRGYRVEPAEVESALRGHAQVTEAVVLARPAATGEPQLVAYAVTDGTVAVEELMRHLADWVPEYMLPSAIVMLDAFPQTPSGKIDRLALPDPETADPAAGAAHVAPRTPMEEAVAEIWTRVLGVERVSVDEDFFALGGHSLLATQVVAQVRSDFAVELPLHSLFTYPTVESLTAEIVRMMGDTDGDETAQLLAELESLSDEEAERLLAGDEPRH